VSLRLAGVRYGYAGAAGDVLADIDLAVEPGEVFGIVGPNEAGKSTLCLVASGLAPAAIGGRLGGSVLLDGRETRELKPHEAAQRCGILFQNPATQLSGTAPTVFEEIAFGPRNLGLDLGSIVERVESALGALGIEHLAPRDPFRLSGGEAQLVALAGVLALRPRVLVLDEPTSQLDPAGSRLVGDALSQLASSSGTAILVVEHKTSLLAQLADSVAILDAGRIVAAGPAASILSDESLAAHGVQVPAEVSIRRAAEAAGVAERLSGMDLVGLATARVVR
jgi:energy-coupling factor transport system ATP-binding protein